MSDDHSYFEFHDDESECPTEISEETVSTSATASECATASASVTMATSRPTRTQYWESALRLVNSERRFDIALRNAHFRYRGSIEYRDTRDGIVIVAPISGIAQHYLRRYGPIM